MADPSQNRGCLGFLFPKTASSEPPKAKRDPADLEGAWPYRSKPLLSPAEFSFFRVLEKAVGDGGVVHVKVRLGDLLTGWKGQPGEKTWWNKIAQKHADFVVCSRDTVDVVAVVELDDASHGGARARAADEVKDRALKAAGIPVVRIKARKSYAVEEVRKRLAVAIGEG